ncbi:DinB family protein [Niabella ginsengisoli]|uniref:DinB family protein n=1 Tax=Niabella ginsengisoli TaxID=522298 RepID=A0ABS9SKB2_9BACT|nr:DinB family protein [Niabella ginsengisoli]MCH5598816.1 DinB family protein [Niabella ginsengisoli]
MEIQQQIAYDITDAFGELTQIISALNSDQLNTVPFEGSWSIGQVTEHIIKSSSGVPDEKTEETSRAFDEHVSVLKEIFEDMDSKGEADPSLWPDNPPHDTTQLTQSLEENKQTLLQTALSKNLKELCLDMEFPTIGHLTRYEWLSFIVVHTRRHTRQIRNILLHIA